MCALCGLSLLDVCYHLDEALHGFEHTSRQRELVDGPAAVSSLLRLAPLLPPPQLLALGRQHIPAAQPIFLLPPHAGLQLRKFCQACTALIPCGRLGSRGPRMCAICQGVNQSERYRDKLRDSEKCRA